VRKEILYGIAFFSWLVAIMVLSLVSFEDDTALDLDVPNVDKVVHFTFYFVAGILGMLYLHSFKINVTSNKGLLLKLLLGLIGYGIIIEVLQECLTSYRGAELLDVMANTTGAILGILLVRAWLTRYTRPKWKN
jgi:VanZ family protein